MKEYFEMSTKQAIDTLKTHPEKGLKLSEIEMRHEKYGFNELAGKKKKSPVIKFLSQFTEFLIIMLIVAAFISFLIGEWKDATVILIAVLINCTIGFVQEQRSEKAMDALKSLNQATTIVVRNGAQKMLYTRELVPGDLVLLDEGNKVPADLRLIETVGLEIDESILTGESISVKKRTTPILKKESLGDLKNMAFSGTVVRKGHGSGIVAFTGMETEVGKIAGMLSSVKTEKTPLQEKLAKLGMYLGVFALVVSLILISIGFGKGMIYVFDPDLDLTVSDPEVGSDGILFNESIAFNITLDTNDLEDFEALLWVHYTDETGTESNTSYSLEPVKGSVDIYSAKIGPYPENSTVLMGIEAKYTNSNNNDGEYSSQAWELDLTGAGDHGFKDLDEKIREQKGLNMKGLKHYFLLAVALAVAVIPEGLPIIVIITLAFGVQKMAKKNAIIRKLSCVETLGCTTVICSDKTGTLTMNQMTVSDIWMPDRHITVTGSGFDPVGSFKLDNKRIPQMKDKEFTRLIQIAVLNNNAKLLKVKDEWNVIGDPTEGALLTVAGKAGFSLKGLVQKFPKKNEFPFDSDRKMMSTFHEIDENKMVLVKGSPIPTLEKCKFYLKGEQKFELDPKMKNEIVKMNLQLADKALRVLAFAYKEDLTDWNIAEDQAESDLTFVGLMGMMDMPRLEVRDSIGLCETAGMKVAMITGDQKNTAMAVAKKLNIWKKGSKAFTGTELDLLSDEELARNVENVSVFARVSPEHKLRIVSALKKNDHVVAMTGDGVNDAPALKEADIGVAMGITGTDVAKEAADMVLADDNFTSIEIAVEEGRKIYNNIQRFVRYQVSTNVGAIFLLIFSIVLNFPLPLLPVQLLWINIIMDGPPALALSREPSTSGVMKEKPRKKDEGILNSEMLVAIVSMGLVMAIITFIVFVWGYGKYDDITHATTLALTTFVLFQLVNVFNCRSTRESVFKLKLRSNIWLIIAIIVCMILQLGIVYLPFLQDFLHTKPLNGIDWLISFGSAITLLGFDEVRKIISRQLNKGSGKKTRNAAKKK